jgi:hypothetical protein
MFIIKHYKNPHHIEIPKYRNTITVHKSGGSTINFYDNMKLSDCLDYYINIATPIKKISLRMDHLTELQ